MIHWTKSSFDKPQAMRRKWRMKKKARQKLRGVRLFDKNYVEFVTKLWVSQWPFWNVRVKVRARALQKSLWKVGKILQLGKMIDVQIWKRADVPFWWSMIDDRSSIIELVWSLVGDTYNDWKAKPLLYYFFLFITPSRTSIVTFCSTYTFTIHVITRSKTNESITQNLFVSITPRNKIE